jgi:hypothetical protein
MGSLSRFDLGRIIKEYDTPNMFETGTFLGEGVAYALKAPFTKIISVEIIPGIAAKARTRFASEHKVEIIESDSIAALQQKLPSLNGNIIFWLDAHFPGADAQMVDHASGDDELLRLPLMNELEYICKHRSKFRDVLILDDLRIYEDGPYQNGLVPSNAMPKGERNIDFVYRCFENTHYIFKSYLDEGYLLLFPKKKYDRNHFNLLDLFKPKPVIEEHYLLMQ